MTQTNPDTGPCAAALVEGEVHIWIADLDSVEPTGLGTRPMDLLSIDERERAARFASRGDSRRWAHSRAWLRLLLGRYLDADPAELRFELGEHGKPRLAGEHARLRFNASHSAGVALYALALEREVGVDVERTGRTRDVLAVAGRAFGADVRGRLARLDGERREREFLRLWTRHEARLKCWGVGLGGAERWAGERECWTIDVELGRGAAAAVTAAYAGGGRVPALRLGDCRALAPIGRASDRCEDVPDVRFDQRLAAGRLLPSPCHDQAKTSAIP
jgi:4'-phosphopantetheinyl transferase